MRLGEVIPQAGPLENQGRSHPSDSDRKWTDSNDQAGYSRDTMAMATAFEPLNRSLENFLKRLSRTSERSEKSRRVYKKPRCHNLTDV